MIRLFRCVRAHTYNLLVVICLFPLLSLPDFAMAQTLNNCAPVFSGKPELARFEMVKAMARGVNLGGYLEAPQEGDWSQHRMLSETLFQRAREAGFCTIRLPIRWSNHALPASPYTIDPVFFGRVDFAVEMATKYGMNIIVNMHHHRQLDGSPLDAGEFAVSAAILDERYIAIWQQISEHFKDAGKHVLFELLNEPGARFKHAPVELSDLFQKTLDVVRIANPKRFILLGPANWNDAGYLDKMQLPTDRTYIIGTVHNYDPFNFTHQGAAWLAGNPLPTGITCGTTAQRDDLVIALDQALVWSKKKNVPMFIGEFGSYSLGDMVSRAAYTRLARDEMEKRGFSWAYWELSQGFGLYDPVTDQWRESLRNALFGM